MINRMAGVVLLLSATLLAFIPALEWFSAQTPAGRVAATGYESAGALWLLPVVAAGIAVAGAAMMAAAPGRAARVARWAGPLAAVCALLALLVTVWAGTGADVVLTVAGHDVAGPVEAPVHREAAAWAGPMAAIAATALGLAVSVAAWRP